MLCGTPVDSLHGAGEGRQYITKSYGAIYSRSDEGV